jgi:hypothetical protein
MLFVIIYVIQRYGVHGIDVKGGMRDVQWRVVVIVVINPLVDSDDCPF